MDPKLKEIILSGHTTSAIKNLVDAMQTLTGLVERMDSRLYELEAKVGRMNLKTG